ncbi:MAG: CPBP family intramembrane glutamic endopeptidase [Solirubrobacteraceae bacterium]
MSAQGELQPADGQRSDTSATPYWVALAAILLGLSAGLFVTIFLTLVGSALGSPTANPTPAVNIASDYLFDLTFVLAALFFTVPRGWMGRQAFGYRRIPLALGVGGTVLAAAVYYVVTALYGAALNLHGTDKLPSGLGIRTSTVAAAAVAVFVCVAAPMAEEFFFRGFLFGVLRRMRVRVGFVELGPWLAALIVGLLFGAAHVQSAALQYLLPLALFGFLLSVLRWKTGSLYPSMALHSINNSIAFGVNQMGWSVGTIVLVSVGALFAIALVTGPLSRPNGRVVGA